MMQGKFAIRGHFGHNDGAMESSSAQPGASQFTFGRAAVDDSPDELRITIRAKWSWWTFVIAPIIFIVFMLSLISIAGLAWTALVVATGLAIYIGYPWIWILGGVEKLYVTRGHVILRDQVFGIGWNQRFDALRVSNLRYEKPIHAYRYHEERTGCFDYEFLPRRWGSFLTEAEVTQLNTLIREKIAIPPTLS